MTDTEIQRGNRTVWSRLRRRKVVQWGFAYVAASWALLQGIGFLADAFYWPDVTKQIATLVLLIGLPMSLVLAWYHGDRGQQRVTRSELVVLTLLLLSGCGLLWLYAQRGIFDGVEAERVQRAPASTAADSRLSIAVLPFDNRSREADDAFFVDGIHDDILTQLTKVGSLKVIARTSVEQFRDSRLTTREIGERLGVSKILEGGVQRAGDRVRVSVQLIDAATDSHIWADNYDRKLSAGNIFAIQSEVAAAIAVALKATLTASERARIETIPTRNLQAWQAYQLGRQHLAKRNSADLARAEQFLRAAIELDPAFALAYVSLAEILPLEAQYSGASKETTFVDAEQLISKALELDPALAEAWASSGLIALYREQYERAESVLRRAIELNPNYAPARQWYGSTLVSLGRLEEALAQLQRAAELDPLSAVIKVNLGGTLTDVGRFRDAEAAYRSAILLGGSMPSAYWLLANLNAYAFARFVEAVPLAEKAMQLDPGSPLASFPLARLYFDLDDDSKVLELANGAERWPDAPFIELQLALVDLMRRDVIGAVGHAERALEQKAQLHLPLAILRNADMQKGREEAALARYKQAHPELFVQKSPSVNLANYRAAIDLALVLRERGESEAANLLLDGAARVIRTIPRLGVAGYWISDVMIHALRDQKTEALAALRDAEKDGWRGPFWRYYRDIEPNLALIRNEAEFKEIFADIERDMAHQRALLAERPKDAPLELADTGT